MADIASDDAPADTREEHAAAPPPGRYRRGPMSRATKIRRGVLITAGVAALTGVATWYGLRNANPPLTATVLAYHINSTQSVSVKLEVDRTSSRAAICVIEAPDLNGDDVGRQQVNVPAGKHRVVLSTVVKTNGEAITGEVEECQFTS